MLGTVLHLRRELRDSCTLTLRVCRHAVNLFYGMMGRGSGFLCVGLWW